MLTVSLDEKAYVSHRVECLDIISYCKSQLGVDVVRASPNQKTISLHMKNSDWLVIPEQKLLEVTCGDVFHDPYNILGSLRSDLQYYPRDIWLYVLRCQFERVSQIAPFLGRTGIVGDDLGSHIIAGMRQVTYYVQLVIGVCHLLNYCIYFSTFD